MIIERDGLKFHVRPDTLDEYVVKENAYSRKITLTPSDVWLDIGAHIGTFSVRFAGRVDRIIAYEPDPTNFHLLGRNLFLNKITNVYISPAALVGNNDLRRKFYLNTKMNTGSHSFLVKRGRKEITVNCVNINDAIERHAPNKIKMDCEGSEYELIHAIKDWSGIEEIIFEFDFAKLKDVGIHEKYYETLKVLDGIGFSLDYNSNPKSTWHTVVVGRKTAKYVHAST